MENVSLKYFDEIYKKDLLSYSLPENQRIYTALPFEIFNRLEKRTDNLAKPIIILYDNVAIGMFVADYGIDKHNYTENKNSLLIRALSLNPKYQGIGLAKQVMQKLDFFVYENYESIDELVLGVNFNNLDAYNLYLKVGFVGNGKIINGLQGLQHVLSKEIIYEP